MKILARVRRSVRTLGRLLPRQFTTVAALVVTANLYGCLLLAIRTREAKFVLSRLLGRRGNKPRTEYGWASRLLLSQLRRVQCLAERIGDRGRLQEQISRSLGNCGCMLSANARLSLAEQFLAAAVQPLPRFSDLRIDYVQTLGVLRFMQGKMHEAMPCFAEVAETKHILQSRCGVPKNLRILGQSWFAALGHVAMIDFLYKKQKLGWEDAETVFFNTNDLRAVPGQTLLREFQNRGVVLAWPENIKSVFDQLVERENEKANGVEALNVKRESFAGNGTKSAALPMLGSRQFRTWDYLETMERSALVDEFWECFFPDGEGLPYSHAAAKIQNQWEAENRAPLFQRRDETDAALQLLRRQLGIPPDAWYVCLHVRQPSFHSRWNKVWEQARDADIRTYTSAIQAIRERGGYVIRMGDPDMPPLPRIDGAVDYARSELKSEYSDILLLSAARFFLGTNSGLSIVPAIYGVPCVLTNWVPIGIPNWFNKDLMIPKLPRYKGSGNVVALEEMFASNLGYVQNPRDLPAGVEFVDNTPEELAAVVTQMLCELDGDANNVRDRRLEEAYFSLAVRLGSYRGSRIGTAFMHEHGKALAFSWEQEIRSHVAPEWRAGLQVQ